MTLFLQDHKKQSGKTQQQYQTGQKYMKYESPFGQLYLSHPSKSLSPRKRSYILKKT